MSWFLLYFIHVLVAVTFSVLSLYLVVPRVSFYISFYIYCSWSYPIIIAGVLCTLRLGQWCVNVGFPDHIHFFALTFHAEACHVLKGGNAHLLEALGHSH